MSKPRVLVADDNEDMLKKLASLLAPDFEVVAAVGDGQAMLDAAARLHPDLVVVDISMPVLNGIDAAERLRKTNTTKVIFLTVNDDPETIQAALATGALGYVSKLRMGADLLQAIKLALKGRSFISPGLK